MRRALTALALSALWLAAGAGPAQAISTIVVDDDLAQCPNAAYTDLDKAVLNAQSHDIVRICPGDYPVDTEAGPSTARCPLSAANGLRINKSLELRGAGAALVTVHPTRNIGNGNPRDFTGDVITVCQSQPGSTSVQDVNAVITGMTVTDGGFNVDAGVNFHNTYGSISATTIGPFTGPGLSWGLAATNNGYSVTPFGAFTRIVTATGLKVFGYGAGGILIDGSQAPAAMSTTRSGIATALNLSASTVTGSANPALTGQYGIQMNAGARGVIQTSAITGNQASDPRFGVGVLLTDADTALGTGTPGITPPICGNTCFTRIGNNNITANGHGIFNANNTNSAVQLGQPVNIGSPGANHFSASLTTPQIAASGPDSAAAPSVLPAPSASTTARTIAATPSATADALPSASWGSPSAGDELIAGEEVTLIVAADDDFDVQELDIEIFDDTDPTPVSLHTDSTVQLPYVFSWTPGTELESHTVTMVATATDFAGQTAVAEVEVPVIPEPVVEPPPPPPPVDTPPATPEPLVSAIDSAVIKSKKKKARFKFSAIGGTAPLAMECKLDGTDWDGCSSPISYRPLDPGKHVFKVRAVDAAGEVSQAVRRQFAIKK